MKLIKRNLVNKNLLFVNTSKFCYLASFSKGHRFFLVSRLFFGMVQSLNNASGNSSLALHKIHYWIEMIHEELIVHEIKVVGHCRERERERWIIRDRIWKTTVSLVSDHVLLLLFSLFFHALRRPQCVLLQPYLPLFTFLNESHIELQHWFNRPWGQTLYLVWFCLPSNLLRESRRGIWKKCEFVHLNPRGDVRVLINRTCIQPLDTEYQTRSVVLFETLVPNAFWMSASHFARVRGCVGNSQRSTKTLNISEIFPVQIQTTNNEVSLSIFRDSWLKTTKWDEKCDHRHFAFKT